MTPTRPIKPELHSLDTQIAAFEDVFDADFIPYPATGRLLEHLKALKAKMEAAERLRDEQNKQQPPA
jgi:hypothetical protein